MNQGNIAESLQPGAQPAGPGCMELIGWHGAGFVLPAASLSFYRRAVSRSVGSAVLFFILFMGVITVFSTVGVTRSLGMVSGEIRQAFQSGKIPEITISGGIASVKGPQPAVLLDNDNIFLVVDTTGRYTSIDQSRYTSGLLLTRTELHVLSRNDYQVFYLSQLQEAFNRDPLVINAETTARLWQSLTVLMAVVILTALAFWNLGVRLIYLAGLAVILWGGTNLFRPKTPYGQVFTVGVYAFVPALYLTFIIDRLGRSFFLLQTLLFLFTWIVGLVVAFAREGRDWIGPDRPLRAWRAWLGLPMLIVFALDLVFSWPNGGWIDLIIGALSGILLIAAGLLIRPHAETTATPPGGNAGFPPPVGGA